MNYIVGIVFVAVGIAFLCLPRWSEPEWKQAAITWQDNAHRLEGVAKDSQETAERWERIANEYRDELRRSAAVGQWKNYDSDGVLISEWGYIRLSPPFNDSTIPPQAEEAIKK